MNKKFSTFQTVRIALLGAILCASQWITPLPNMELISLLIIIYTLVYGREALYSLIVFDIYMGIQGGFGLWWFSYLYVWPILYFLTLLLKPLVKEDFVIWSIVSGVYGMLFGSFFALAYIPIDPKFALTYWISGLTWDAFHAISNFVLMLIIGKPIFITLKILERRRSSNVQKRL